MSFNDTLKVPNFAEWMAIVDLAFQRNAQMFHSRESSDFGLEAAAWEQSALHIEIGQTAFKTFSGASRKTPLTDPLEYNMQYRQKFIAML